MLFILVILTFAACLFGVIAIEVSIRQREERGRSGEGTAEQDGSVPDVFGERRQPGDRVAPAARGRGSRAA